jgi:hypothetical protein
MKTTLCLTLFAALLAFTGCTRTPTQPPIISWDNGKAGLLDQNGKVIVPIQYDDIDEFSEGLACVTVGRSAYKRKCGFINMTGKVVIPLKYDFADSFSEGLAVVRLDGKYGFINKRGKVVVPLKYDNVATPFSEGSARVLLGNREFFINKTGKEVKR